MQYPVSHSRTGSNDHELVTRIGPSRDVTVQAIVRAFDLLGALSDAPSSSVTEIAQRLGMHKSTAHRLLTTLAGVGYVVQDEMTQRYSLSLKVLDLAASVLPAIDVRARALPVMQRLVQDVQETVHLGVMVDDEVVCLESAVSPRPMSVMRLVGKHGPVHVSSMGKVILAYRADPDVERLIAQRGLPRLTERSITDPQDFRDHLRLVRSRGWAVNADEEELGLGCVAAPIRDHRGEVVAALSIAAPTVRMMEPRLRQLVEMAMQGAQKVSASLGYDAGGQVARAAGGNPKRQEETGNSPGRQGRQIGTEEIAST